MLCYIKSLAASIILKEKLRPVEGVRLLYNLIPKMCCNLVHIVQNAIFKWNKANVILNYFNIYP